MIPIRIKLEGFLSYREEQTLVFDGASLWVLAGHNGAGKSTVFDAVTFALYGKLRDGGYRLEDILNHHSDRLLVEFDFELDGAIYRIRRTRSRRGAPTFGAFCLLYPGSNYEPTVDQIDDTDREDGLNRWVQETVGLGFKTFTSSVLLRQGKADQLLTEEPRERFKTLEELIDLSAYRRLHDCVYDRLRELTNLEEQLSKQLESQPAVTDEEIASAEEGLALARGNTEAANQEVERLTTLLDAARRWEALRTRLEEIDAQRAQDRALIDRADEIQNGCSRWQDLGRVLPNMRALVDDREHLRELQGQIATHERAIVDLEPNLQDAELAERQADDHLARLTADLEARQEEREVIHRALRDLLPLTSKLADLEACEEEISRRQVELRTLPENLNEAIAEAETRIEFLDELITALPSLDEIVTARTDLDQALGAFRDATCALEEVQQVRANHNRPLADAEIAVAEADEARRAAADMLARAEQARDDALDRRQRFEQAAGEKFCGVCGQEITKDHAVVERARLAEEVTQREAAVEQARHMLADVDRSLDSTRDRYRRLVSEREAFDEQERRRERERERAQADVDQLADRIRRAYRRLPNTYRQRVALTAWDEPSAWIKIVFPTEAEVEALREEAAERDAHASMLEQFREQLQQRTRIAGQLEAHYDRKAAIEIAYLRSDLLAARELQESELKRQVMIETAIVELRAQRDEACDTADWRRAHAEALRKRLASHREERKAARAAADTVEKHCNDVHDRLPTVWQAQLEQATRDELDAWEEEHQQLASYPVLREQLLGARERVAALDQQKAECQGELDGLPSEAHRDSAVVEEELGRAKERQKKTTAEQVECGQTLARLQEHHDQRRKLEGQRAEADRERHLHQLLANHLGRKGLQRDLLRYAERGIVEEANDILDRLSDGRMRLRLRSDGSMQADKALDILVHDLRTGTKETPIGLISGSQRFRVAVSLALAIGRYLGREARRIQSVIIDEGFGSLDRDGRTTMIQELESLQGELCRIILVSHQEEIAEAFPNCYTISLVDGASNVALVSER